MKSIGVVRKVDELGRVTLPKEWRLSLGIEPNTPLEMFADEKGLYLKKYSVGCTFCQGVDELVEFGGTHICRGCAKAILAK